MYKIKLEEKEYEMPSGWDEVTLKNLMIINSIITKEYNSELKMIVDLISVLSGIEKEILLELDFTELNKFDFNWLNKSFNKKIVNEFTINDKKYKMIKDFKKLKFGEYVDLDYYMKDLTNNLHYIVGILVREVDENGNILKYDNNTLEERANIFYENIKIEEVLGIVDFFQNGVNGS
jgi:hypothetical protein